MANGMTNLARVLAAACLAASMATSVAGIGVAGEAAGTMAQAQSTSDNASKAAEAAFPAADVSDALAKAADAARQVADCENTFLSLVAGGGSYGDQLVAETKKMKQLFSATDQDMCVTWFGGGLKDGHSCTWTTTKDGQYQQDGTVRVTWLGTDADGTVLAYAQADYDPRSKVFDNGSFDYTEYASTLMKVNADASN